MFVYWKRTLQKPLAGFIPFTASTQDKAFMKLVKDVQGMDALCRKLLVVRGFRGCRKTHVAKRCAIRSSRFFWQPYVEYWDLSDLNVEELHGFLDTKFSFDTSIWAIHSDVFIWSFVTCVFLGVAWCAFGWYNSGRKLSELYQETKDAIVDEFPTKAGCIFGGSIVFLLLFRRKPIIVLDEPFTAFSVRTTGKKPRYVLERISKIGQYNKVILISSNDAIDQCFEDEAVFLRIFASFPPATPQELVYILNDVSELSQYNISLSIVQSAANQHMLHHAFSVKWWYNMHLSRGLANVIEGKPPPRHSLWEVVLHLDCKCSKTFRAQGLGLSEAISDNDCEKLENLTGTKPPKNYPRRLALAWCMIASASIDECNELRTLQAALCEANDVDDTLTQSVYERHLAPLVQLIERKLRDATTEAECPIEKQ